MISKDDINIQEIALEYLKAILQSKNKEFTIKQIVDDIKKKYPSEKQPLIISELRKRLMALSYSRGYSHGSDRDILYEVRAQANEEYIKYVELLDDLTKR